MPPQRPRTEVKRCLKNSELARQTNGGGHPAASLLSPKSVIISKDELKRSGCEIDRNGNEIIVAAKDQETQVLAARSVGSENARNWGGAER